MFSSLAPSFLSAKLASVCRVRMRPHVERIVLSNNSSRMDLIRPSEASWKLGSGRAAPFLLIQPPGCTASVWRGRLMSVLCSSTSLLVISVAERYGEALWRGRVSRLQDNAASLVDLFDFLDLAAGIEGLYGVCQLVVIREPATLKLGEDDLELLLSILEADNLKRAVTALVFACDDAEGATVVAQDLEAGILCENGVLAATRRQRIRSVDAVRRHGGVVSAHSAPSGAEARLGAVSAHSGCSRSGPRRLTSWPSGSYSFTLYRTRCGPSESACCDWESGP